MKKEIIGMVKAILPVTLGVTFGLLLADEIKKRMNKTASIS